MLGFLSASVLSAVLISPMQGNQISVYVTAPIRDGFVDAVKDVQDSVKDVQKKFPRGSMRLAASAADADVVLTIVARGVGSESFGQRLTLTRYYNNTVLTSAPMYSSTWWVAGVIEVGTYRKEFSGTYTHPPGLAYYGGAWTTCAGEIVKGLESWISANSESLLRNARSVSTNPPTAGSNVVADLTSRAGRGEAEAEYDLGFRYEIGNGVSRDDVQAIAMYRRAAEHGFAAAQFRLGYRYANGLGVSRDDDQAALWFRKAANQGDAAAQMNLAVLLYRGAGALRNIDEALIWYKKAAEQGDVNAQMGLGRIYLEGNGVVRDETQAAVWYKKAADQENTDAQIVLARLTAAGAGVARDAAAATALYRRAADQGSPVAQMQLGLSFHNGDGVTKDFAQAAAWYRKAADQGFADAMFRLGEMLVVGEGAPQDFVEAHKWLNLAAALCPPEKQTVYADARNALAKQMTADQLANAQQAARAWLDTFQKK